MAQTNSINNQSGSLTVDSAAASDSFIQLNINTTGEWRFGCDDTDDSFRISQGSALGTNDTFIMTAAGENTLPLQPAFFAVANTQNNVTGDGTIYTIPYANEIIDRGNDFSSTTFTAPITGKYFLTGNLRAGGFTDSNMGNFDYRINTSNRLYYSKWGMYYGRNPDNQAGQIINALADMDASDTAITTFDVALSTKIVDIVGSSASTCFGGYLAT